MTEEHHDWREEIWNALTHGFGFLVSLTASAVLITLVALRGNGWQLAGALVFWTLAGHRLHWLRRSTIRFRTWRPRCR